MKYISIKSKEVFEENPFVQKAIQEINIVRKTQIIRPKDKNEIQMIVSQSGEVSGHTAFMKFIEVDEEKFAKMYLSQFFNFWEMNKPAIRVLGYILTVLKPNNDVFFFSMSDCLNYTKYNHRNSVLLGISCLIELGIIARTKDHYRYFINPLCMFNGSRVTFAKTYIKKVKDTQLALPFGSDTIETNEHEEV